MTVRATLLSTFNHIVSRLARGKQAGEHTKLETMTSAVDFGPLYRLALTVPSIGHGWTQYSTAAQSAFLLCAPDWIDTKSSRTIISHWAESFAVPMFILLRHHLRKYPRPVVVGFSAPQGFGKTTFACALKDMFGLDGLHLISMSMDDFYYPKLDMDRLIEERSNKNKLYAGRGLPGTHDVDLACDVVSQLKNSSPGVAYPRYDKGAFENQGDRVLKSQWGGVSAPVDVVFFEGWMLEFKAVDNEDSILREDLKEVNRYIPVYEFYSDNWSVKGAALIVSVNECRLPISVTFQQ